MSRGTLGRVSIAKYMSDWAYVLIFATLGNDQAKNLACVVRIPVRHAARGLIGFPSSGKTTLFQLLTSAREAPRTHGKTEANVGVSRVPDERLDRLTAMFKPKKRVPATVEFADMAAGRGDAKSLLDVVGVSQRRRAAPRRARVRRSARAASARQQSIRARDARTIEEELILADLGVVERRLERLEKDLKKTPSADLKQRAGRARAVPRAARRRAARCARSGLSGDDAHRLRGFQFLSAKPLLLVVNVDEARRRRRRSTPRTHADSRTLLASRRRGRGRRVREDRARDRAARRRGCRRRSGRSRPQAIGPRSHHPRGVRACSATSRSSRSARTNAARGRFRVHTPAPLAAGAIHSDIQRGFIRAEVVAVRSAARARLARRLPRSRRAASRGQGISRRGRRRDQLPPRHVIASARSCARFWSAKRRCRSSVAAPKRTCASSSRQLRAAGLRRRARQRSLQVVSEERDSARTPPRGGCSISPRATAGRSISSIGTKFPTYFARHPRKVTWLIHQHRAAYELAGTPYSDFAHAEHDVALRERLDRARHGRCSANRRGCSANSATIAEAPRALQRPRGRAALPSAAPGRGCTARRRGRLRAVGRPSRIGQARRSGDSRDGARCRRRLSLVIAGTGTTARRSKRSSRRSAWRIRVQFLGEVDDDADHRALRRRARRHLSAVRRGLGYVTLEAFSPHKPVITTTDAGGPNEFVRGRRERLRDRPRSRGDRRRRSPRSTPTGAAPHAWATPATIGRAADHLDRRHRDGWSADGLS